MFCMRVREAVLEVAMVGRLGQVGDRARPGLERMAFWPCLDILFVFIFLENLVSEVFPIRGLRTWMTWVGVA